MHYVRLNTYGQTEASFMNKKIKKEIMNKTRPKNKYLKIRMEENEINYKKQRNYCVLLIWKEKKHYCSNLDTKIYHHHSFNVSVPLKVGRTAPMFVLSFFLHSILLAGSALDSFQCLRSLLIVSFHVFFGLPRPRCPTTSNSVMLLIQPSFLTTCPKPT